MRKKQTHFGKRAAVAQNVLATKKTMRKKTTINKS